MLETYFKQCLSDFGFDSSRMELSYSIGFCQSDYVSFRGHIGLSTAKRLFMKMHGIDVGPESELHTLVPDQIHYMFLVLENFGQCDLCITDRNYVGSMYVETSDDFESIFDYDFQAILGTFNGDIEWEHGNVWHKHWCDFLRWLKEAVKELSSKMLDDGHEITLACTQYDGVIREKETTNYLVQVCSDLERHLDVEYVDPSQLRETMIALRDGKLKMMGMYAVVFDSISRRVLGRSVTQSYCGPTTGRDDYFLSIQRALVREAIDDTRSLLGRHQALA